jgi:hypothetical protein
MLPDKAIFEFQAIFKKEIGEEISLDLAGQKAENFIQLFDLAFAPYPTNNKETFEESNEI